MGVGNFFSLIPENLSESKLYGVELDSITGRIAKQLYQKADIRVQGYETVDFPDNFFDIAIGNVPFGSYKLADKKYDNLNLYIHDYFFAKTIDKVRAGGIIAFVTSKGTLDKKTPKSANI
jgi:adenine-specific DNA methylase